MKIKPDQKLLRDTLHAIEQGPKGQMDFLQREMHDYVVACRLASGPNAKRAAYWLGRVSDKAQLLQQTINMWTKITV